MTRHGCRLCNVTLSEPVLNLGRQPPSNAFTREQTAFYDSYPLRLVQCPNCSLLQLDYDVPPATIFNESYALHSSKGSAQWLDHASRLTEYIWDRFELDSRKLVMEIGSNDGYLLRNMLGACQVLGIDPTGIPADVPTIKAPFTAELAEKLPKADVVLALNTVAQIPDLRDFIKGVERVLKLDGVAIFEFPDLVTTIEGTQFDTIYHEHYSYLSVQALQNALPLYGLCIYDLQYLPTHGGSVRVFIGRLGMDICPIVQDHMDEEHNLDLVKFREMVFHCQQEFLWWLSSVNMIDSKVCAYGAAARGNTFLNSCAPQIHEGEIRMIGDTIPAKIGKFAPGTGLPVVSDEDLLASKPDYIVLLCWTWRAEAMARLRAKGYTGKFVVALPHLEVFS